MRLTIARFAAVAAIPLMVTTMADAAPTTDIPAEANRNIAAGKRGQTIAVPGFDMNAVPSAPLELKPGGPQYLFSDDPEYFRVPEAVGMREKVRPGVVRLYIYHVNGTTDTVKKISTVIENMGDRPMTVRFLRYASTGPSTDYYTVGKSGLVQFFNSKPQNRTVVIAPGGGAPLDEAMDNARVKFDELVHGFYEFEVDQPAQVSTVMTDPEVPSLEASRRNPVQPPKKKGEGAGRGSFAPSDYDVSAAKGAAVDTANGPVKLIVADGKTDPWIKGTDSSRSTGTLLKGNYGVVYRIRLKRASSDGRGLAVLMWNQHSDAMWCGGMAAAVKISEGDFPGGIVEVPSDRVCVKGAPDAVLVQRFAPLAPGEQQEVEIVYSPPGASCLPVPIVLVPYTPGK